MEHKIVFVYSFLIIKFANLFWFSCAFLCWSSKYIVQQSAR